MTTEKDVNRLIGCYLRASLLSAPDHAEIGPFAVKFNGASASPFLSYAAPRDDAKPTEDEVLTLIEAFRARGRVARLEYIPAAAPEVEPVLLAAGFEAEARYPLMVCDDIKPLSAEGIQFALAGTGAEFEAAVNAGNDAYHEDGFTVDVMSDLVQHGALLALALDGGQTVGIGMATAAQDGVVEIAGIGVIDEYRQRGIGGAITAFVTREAFARGARLAWLTPGSDAAERIYARAGFEPRSEQLHISKPD